MKRKLIAACVGGLLGSYWGLASAQPGAVFFGDSLTDAGYYAPALPPGTGRFTTNPGPVWSELMASRYGWDATPSNRGGNNFAAGGARVTGLPGIPPSPPTAAAPPLQAQIDSFLLRTGGRASSNTPHFIWSGANDIFFAAGAGLPALQTQAYVQQTAAEAVTEIGRLAQAGATHLVVINLPNIGATPFGTAQGPAGAAGLTSLSTTYNTALFRGLAGAGTNVLALDAFALLSEVQADPARFGFANASLPACGATPSLVCTSADLVTPGADESFVFADGVHPTSGGHRLIADYVDGMLRAPALIGQLAEMPLRNQVALSRELWRSGTWSLDTIAPGETTGWVRAGGGSTKVNGIDASPTDLSAGVEYRVDENRLAGVALSFSNSKPDWGSAGHYRLRDYAISVYGVQRTGALSISGLASFARLDFDTRRRQALGTTVREMRGSTDGGRLSLGARLDYTFEAGALRHGPLASLLYQRINISDFDERANDGSSSSNLAYRMQKRRSTIASVGWQASLDAGKWQPYGEFSLNRDLQNRRSPVRIATSASDALYTAPTVDVARSFASVKLGVRGQLSEQTWVDLGVDQIAMRSGLRDLRAGASMRVRF